MKLHFFRGAAMLLWGIATEKLHKRSAGLRVTGEGEQLELCTSPVVSPETLVEGLMTEKNAMPEFFK